MSNKVEYTSPLERVKEVTHRFFKEGQNSWLDAKASAKIAIELLINDHKHAGNLLAVSYWKQVKKELKSI